MSSAHRLSAAENYANWLRADYVRYGFVFLSVGIAIVMRTSLHSVFGFRNPFLLFYPAILAIALLAGFWPALVSTLLAGIAEEYFLAGPLNLAAGHSGGDIAELVLFVIVGASISGLVHAIRRRGSKLQEFERAVDGLEEMIVVVDRQYRYLIANRAFLRYRGMKREDLIGRCIAGVLNPGVFETTVKAKLDECFQGKIVEYRMRYEYATHGERHLLIKYFPVQGKNGVDRVACVLRDATDEELADRAVKLFRVLIDHSNDAVEVIDPETSRFVDNNEKACEDRGYSREELLSMSVFDLEPNAEQSWSESVHKLQAAGSTVRESIRRRKDGSTFPVETSLKYVQLDRGYIIAVSRDISDRKQAEAALRESEDRYRDLVEHSEDLVCTHDLEGNLLSVNSAPARLLGYEVPELLKIRMRDFVAPEFRDEFDGYLHRIRTTGSDKGLLCVMARDGDRRLWEYSNTLRTEGVATPIVRGIAHDVTERKRAEAALAQGEGRIRLLNEHAPAAVAVFDCEMRYIQASRRWREYYRLGDRELYGVSHYEVFPGLPERWKEAHRRGLAGEIVREERDRYEHADGTVQWVRWEIHPWYVRDQIGGIALFAEDITADEEHAEALRNSEKRYRMLFEKTVAGVGIFALDGRVVDCNDALARMFGYSTGADFRGCSIVEHYTDSGAREGLVSKLKTAGSFLNFEWEFVRKDGRSLWVLINSVMMDDGRGEPLIQSTVLDITDRKQAEQALIKSERLERERAKELQTILNTLPIPVLISRDPECHRISMNQAAAEHFGAPAEGDSAQMVFPGEFLRLRFMQGEAELCKEQMPMERAAATGEAVTNTALKGIVPDGTEKYQLWNAAPLMDESGKVQGAVGAALDITDQIRAEEALRQSEERFRVALKDSPIAVFNQDSELRYTWIYNPQLYWQDDVIGKTDEDIIGKKAHALMDLKKRVLQSGIAVREEVAVPKDGTSCVFDMTIEPLFGPDREVIGITGACMDIARLREMADRLQEVTHKLVQQKSYLEEQIQTELGFEEIIGQSGSLREVLRKARIVASTDSTVLLLGETGTGKEMVARSIHELSERHENAFVKLNCAAVPSGLLESELFGHEKGAFTGAVTQKIGRIELAHKGTLLLDEIGELPLEIQPKLLRVLQDREFERLGGVKTLCVDVRIIAATNRDLRQEVADKNFREDLFYRLNVFPIELPPLRDRAEDIASLVQHFVRKHTAKMGKHIDDIPDEAMEILRKWSWPGNVRELENMIERMVILTKGRTLAAPPAEIQCEIGKAEDDLIDMEREHIIRILRETNGVLAGESGAASRLGMKRTTLQSMMKRLGIEAHHYRDWSTGTPGRH